MAGYDGAGDVASSPLRCRPQMTTANSYFGPSQVEKVCAMACSYWGPFRWDCLLPNSNNFYFVLT